MNRCVATGLLWGLSALAACIGGDGRSDHQRPAKAQEAPKAPAKAPPVADDRRPEFVPAAAGDADAAVREALHAAQAQERQLVVYVGATWCEPCQAFHQAVERGELDEALAGVRFLEFDSDQDGDRLRAADYGGRLIPRFVLPGSDGRGTDQRMEGGIKGEGAVAHLMQRLQPLLASAG